MKTYDTVKPEIIKQHIGDYIILNGKGLIDGLTGDFTKYDADRIVKLDDEGMHVRQYNRRNNCYLPYWNFDQACAILSTREYKKLPSPSWMKRNQRKDKTMTRYKIATIILGIILVITIAYIALEIDTILFEDGSFIIDGCLPGYLCKQQRGQDYEPNPIPTDERSLA